MFEPLFSKPLYLILSVLAAVILLLGSFSLGLHIGERKARHLDGRFTQYERDFNRPFRSPLPGGHGVFGKIISVSNSTVLVQGKDGTEQSVVVTSSTAIRAGRDAGSFQLLKPDLSVAVFGEPDDQGQIEAHLIRLFDASVRRSF